MQIDELRHFLVLAETLHFGKSSQLCNVSASALSRALRRIEEEVGRALFVRDRRSVELTAAGERFRAYARGVVEGWEALREELMEGSRRLSGELRLYSSVTASYAVLAELFARFRRAYPGIHIRLQTGDAAGAVDAVLDGSADITVAARPDRLPESLRFRLITETPLEFVAPRAGCEVARLASSATVDWRGLPMILATHGLSRTRTDTWFRRKGIRPTIYAEVSGHEAILSMVSLGCGVGVIPRLVMETSALRGEVKVLDVRPRLEPYAVGLCAHRKRLSSPLVRAFWDEVPERPPT